MPPKKARTTDPLPKRKLPTPLKRTRKSSPPPPRPPRVDKSAPKRKSDSEEYEDSPRGKKGRRQSRKAPPSVSSVEVEEEVEDDRERTVKHEEDESGSENSDDEEPDGTQTQNTSSSPAGDQWVLAQCKAFALEIRNQAPKTSKHDKDFEQLMEDFETIYSDAQEELNETAQGDNDSEQRSKTVTVTFQTILDNLQEEDTNLQRFTDNFRARNSAVFGFQDAYAAFLQTHKPLIEALKEGSKKLAKRSNSIHASISELEKTQHQVLIKHQEMAKVNLDAKGLIKGARKFLRSAR